MKWPCRIFRLEFGKLIKAPFMWVLFVTFVAFNSFYVFDNTQMSGADAARMHDTILSPDMRGDGGDEYLDFYTGYIQEYGTMYDNLDMMSVLSNKKEIYNYHPEGAYNAFITAWYERLQKRVDEIKSTGEADCCSEGRCWR